jgi:hypothetical protein
MRVGGVVIGRGGSVVKALSDNTNAKISLGQKDQVVPVSERIVTVSADADENIIAVCLLNHRFAGMNHLVRCRQLNLFSVSF